MCGFLIDFLFEGCGTASLGVANVGRDDESVQGQGLQQAGHLAQELAQPKGQEIERYSVRPAILMCVCACAARTHRTHVGRLLCVQLET